MFIQNTVDTVGLPDLIVDARAAAYGGLFVVLSLLWGWWMDGQRADVPSVAGAALCLAGAAVIMYWPRPV